jgi:hypothetical protein
MLGQLVRFFADPIEPVLAEGHHPGPELLEAVVRAASTDQVGRGPDVPFAESGHGVVEVGIPVENVVEIARGKIGGERESELRSAVVAHQSGARKLDHVPELVDLHGAEFRTPI